MLSAENVIIETLNVWALLGHVVDLCRFMQALCKQETGLWGTCSKETLALCRGAQTDERETEKNESVSFWPQWPEELERKSLSLRQYQRV